MGSSSISGTASRTGCTSDAERELPEAALATLRLGWSAALVALVASVGTVWALVYGLGHLEIRDEFLEVASAIVFLLCAPAVIFVGPLAAFALAATGKKPSLRDVLLVALRRSPQATLCAVPEYMFLAVLTATAREVAMIRGSTADLIFIVPFLPGFYYLSRRSVLYLTVLLAPAPGRAPREVAREVWSRHRRKILLAGLAPATLVIALSVGPSGRIVSQLGIKGWFVREAGMIASLPPFVLLEALIFASVVALDRKGAES